MNIFIRGKLTKADGRALEAKDFTAGTNNFLHSLFSQCNIPLKGVTVTPATEACHYRSYIETLLTYASNEAIIHLKNAYWYLDHGDHSPCTDKDSKNKGFIVR
jgi:hypothetical protein